VRKRGARATAPARGHHEARCETRRPSVPVEHDDPEPSQHTRAPSTAGGGGRGPGTSPGTGTGHGTGTVESGR
jgi:hypothetical protein